MDRRLLLAIGLMLIVAVLPSILWPPDRSPQAAGGLDTLTAPGARATGPDTPAARAPARPAPPPAARVERPPVDTQPAVDVTERQVVVESDVYRLVFSTRGGRLVGATLLAYRSFAPGDSGPAQVIPDSSAYLAYRFVSRTDTVALSALDLEPDRDRVHVGPGGATLSWRGQDQGRDVRLTYRFAPDAYRFHVDGAISGAPAGVVEVGLGPRLRSIDADTVADIRAYGVVTKANKTDRLNFRSLDPGERRELAGPFEWVAIKSKYFVTAVLAIDDGEAAFGGVVAVGGQRTGNAATAVSTTASLPSSDGRFAHSVYVGPQEYRHLAHIGHGFEDVNPYGWILRPIIRPVANFIVRILLWLHETLNLAYGWVLILFGLMVRLLLWPLNQKAMRSSTEMQALQPDIKALQDRLKGDPQRLQQETMKLYKERGVNPLGGCLPMLIPMPVLFALFFVFANTIEFRGVPFLWLPDLSRADPLYIIPLLMGASMFAVSKIGQRGVPPNPQARMMTYIMPVMLTLLFFRFSAGLNLYYAVSNIASIPQQWMISNERIRRLGRRAGKG